MHDRWRVIFMAGVVALLLVAGASISWRERIATNVLDLIPDAEKSEPTLEMARNFLQSKSSRIMLFALVSEESEPPVEAAEMFSNQLEESGFFSEIHYSSEAIGESDWTRLLFEKRLELFFPGWLESMRDEAAIGQAAAEKLKAFLLQPEYVFFQQSLSADPLLLLPSAFSKAATLLPDREMQTEDGRGVARIWTRLSPSPFQEEGQVPVLERIEELRASLPAGVTLEFTGVNRFAQESRFGIEREIRRISLLGFCLASFIAFVGLRSLRLMIHLFVPVMLAMPCALVCGVFVFENVHLLALALSSILFGVGVDYGLHAILHKEKGEGYEHTLRRLAGPLILGLLTSVAGFACLLFSNLPVLRQMGFLVAAGLCFAMFFLIVYLPIIRPPAQNGHRFQFPLFVGGKPSLVLLGAMGLFALIGLFRVEWRDSLKDLEFPLPHLFENEAQVQTLFGQNPESAIVLTGGASLEAAIAATQALNEKVTARFNLPLLLPSRAAVENAAAFLKTHPDFERELRAALTGAGFKADAFETFFVDLKKADFTYEETLLQEFLNGLPGMLQDLWQSDSRGVWFVTLLPKEQLAAAREHGAIALDQARTLEDVMGRYRASTIRLALIGYGAMSLVILLCLGWRKGLLTVAVPVLALFLALGILGWTQPASLFTIIGFLLAFCLSVDYAIFTMWDREHPDRARLSVRLSAATTMVSFFVLALSQVPAVRTLGLSVGLMVLFALLLCESLVMLVKTDE